MTSVERRHRDCTPALIRYAVALGWPVLSADDMSLDVCTICGSLIVLHDAPCEPGRCQHSECDKQQGTNDLHLCRQHYQVVLNQLGRAR